MDEKKKKDEILPELEGTKTDIHLLMVMAVTAFNMLLVMVVCLMSWEMWVIPLIIIITAAAWALHILRLIPETTFEYICSGVMMVEFFFYGVHATSLFDMPVVMGVFILMLSMLDKKILLNLTAITYTLVILYHCIVLHTIGPDMGMLNLARLGLDIVGVAAETLVASRIINRRKMENDQMRGMIIGLKRAKDQNADFLSNISHELRTPINMVTGISEVALGRKLSPELREDMASIQMAGLRLSGQIKDILDYTEIVGKTLIPVEDNYMMSSVLGDVIALVSVQNKGTDLELVFDMDVTIPAVLSGDGEKLCRVIKLILDNAIKFTHTGGVCVRIGYRKESYGINLDIDICDTGIGISSTQLSKIYEDFYQVDSGRSRNAGGLGLGISIAHGLLQAMGGFMYIESEENQGTQVHISVPQKVVDESPSMEITNPEMFCIVCYFRADKYSRKEVREFYDDMIYRMAVSLGIEGHRVYHFEEIEKLQQTRSITHLFIAKEEYYENPAYFEELGKSVCVVLIADDGFSLKPDSNLIYFRKPFNPLPIVNLLNGETHGKDAMGGMITDQPFTCDGVHALVVDDEEMNLVVARGVLSNYGMKVDTASGGEEAVEKCVNTEYDIVFLDHMMPVFDGVETLKRIRAIKGGIYQKLPIIALTANAVSGAREMFKNEGFTEFVPKPIERLVLERALRKVLPEQSIHYLEYDNEGAVVYVGAPDEKTSGQQKEDVTKESVEEITEETATQTEPPLEQLRKAGMNIESGLKYCSDSEEFYIEMLRMFYEQSKDKKEGILELFDEKNWDEYAIKVHALKSTSRTIGAEQLSDTAKELEQAGKDGNETYIQENHSDLIRLYDETCGLIAASLGMETV